MVKKFLNKLGKKLIKFQVDQRNLPEFITSKEIRLHTNFSGLVQGVGFRVEVAQLAMRLDITGWIKNLPDSSVEAELQGEREKINFLLESIKEHKRVKVEAIDKKRIRLVKNETNFDIEF